MCKSSEAGRNVVPLKNIVGEGPQQVEVMGRDYTMKDLWVLLHIFGVYPKSSRKSLKGFKQRGMCSELHCKTNKQTKTPPWLLWERPEKR